MFQSGSTTETLISLLCLFSLVRGCLPPVRGWYYRVTNTTTDHLMVPLMPMNLKHFAPHQHSLLDTR